MNFFFQIYFKSQDIYFYPTCKLKNRLQLKSKDYCIQNACPLFFNINDVVELAITGDSKELSVSLP